MRLAGIFSGVCAFFLLAVISSGSFERSLLDLDEGLAVGVRHHLHAAFKDVVINATMTVDGEDRVLTMELDESKSPSLCWQQEFRHSVRREGGSYRRYKAVRTVRQLGPADCRSATQAHPLEGRALRIVCQVPCELLRRCMASVQDAEGESAVAGGFLHSVRIPWCSPDSGRWFQPLRSELDPPGDGTVSLDSMLGLMFPSGDLDVGHREQRAQGREQRAQGGASASLEPYLAFSELSPWELLTVMDEGFRCLENNEHDLGMGMRLYLLDGKGSFTMDCAPLLKGLVEASAGSETSVDYEHSLDITWSATGRLEWDNEKKIVRIFELEIELSGLEDLEASALIKTPDLSDEALFQIAATVSWDAHFRLESAAVLVD